MPLYLVMGLGFFLRPYCGGRLILHPETTCQLFSGHADRWRAHVSVDRRPLVNNKASLGGRQAAPRKSRCALKKFFSRLFYCRF